MLINLTYYQLALVLYCLKQCKPALEQSHLFIPISYFCIHVQLALPFHSATSAFTCSYLCIPMQLYLCIYIQQYLCIHMQLFLCIHMQIYPCIHMQLHTPLYSHLQLYYMLHSHLAIALHSHAAMYTSALTCNLLCIHIQLPLH